MSDRGMNPFIKAFRNFLNSFKLRGAQTKPVMIVGTDLHGNKYFESKGLQFIVRIINLV